MMPANNIFIANSKLRRFFGAIPRVLAAQRKAIALKHEQNAKSDLADKILEVFRRTPSLVAISFTINCRAVEVNGPLRPLHLSCSTMVWLNTSCVPTSLQLPDGSGRTVDVAAQYLQRIGSAAKATDTGLCQALSQHLNEVWPGFNGMAEHFPGIGYAQIFRRDVTDPNEQGRYVDPSQVWCLMAGSIKKKANQTAREQAVNRHCYDGEL